MNKIYVVRHGETDWNKNGICQGKTNISLNENGIAQAKVLKDKINIYMIIWKRKKTYFRIIFEFRVWNLQRNKMEKIW